MELPFDLPAGRQFDVAGFGTNAIDHLVRVDEFPQFGGKSVIDAYAVAPGGEVASTVFGLSRLGLKTAYAGAFGGDEAGRIGRSSLEEAGIDLSGSRIVEDAATQMAFIVIDNASGERTILWKRDPLLAFSPEDAPLSLASKARVLHMTPHDVSACVSMARSAREARTIVSIDIDNAFARVEELLPLVDICLMSETFPSAFTGIDDLEEALRAIQAGFGCAVVGATLGSRGSIVLSQGICVSTGGYDVPGGCVDTTGAGDAFRAGFLFGVLTGVELEACCSTANAVAALKCRRPGAREGLPTKEELKTLLKKI